MVERYNTMKKKAKASLDEAKAEIASLKKQACSKDDSEELEQAQSKLKAVVGALQRAQEEVPDGHQGPEGEPRCSNEGGCVRKRVLRRTGQGHRRARRAAREEQ